MRKVVCKDISKKGVNPTLCDSRNKFDNIDFSCKLETLETSLRKQDNSCRGVYRTQLNIYNGAFSQK